MRKNRSISTATAILIFLMAACNPLHLTTDPERPANAQPVQEQSTDSVNISSKTLSYPIVDTAQTSCFDDSSSVYCPQEGDIYFGQDAQYVGNQPQYKDNGDGTVTDLVTGLMWQQSPDINGDGQINNQDKLTYNDSVTFYASYDLAGYEDWRLPTIKELYSLISFNGLDPNVNSNDTSNLVPFIDTDYFDFGYGDTASGERVIDVQFATSTLYVSTTMNGAETMFGVNLADGRIKGYPTQRKTYYLFLVRGDSGYGENDFNDNGNITITDRATRLTWMQDDSGSGMNWSDALAYCEDLDFAGSGDWRLPNVKELQSIIDYSRSPDTTSSAAIDPLFNVSQITNENEQVDYPFYWSSTTHISMSRGGSSGAYVSFGRALGYMNNQWMDVHGAGAQRSDPKSGDPSRFPFGNGPQGDAIRIDNYVRCVTGGVEEALSDGELLEFITGSQPLQNSPQDSIQAPPDQGSDSPPPEAIEVCSGLTEGSACSINTPNGTLSGACILVQTGDLACVPEGGPQPPTN